MTYITRADIEAIYGAEFLAILVPDGSTIDAAVAQAGTIASGEADLYLCKRYVLPLASVPDGLKMAVIDLACYRLAVTHDRLTDEISQRAKDARKLLEAIAAGKAGLGLAEPQGTGETPATTNGASSGDGAFFEAEPRRFSRRIG